MIGKKYRTHVYELSLFGAGTPFDDCTSVPWVTGYPRGFIRTFPALTSLQYVPTS